MTPAGLALLRGAAQVAFLRPERLFCEVAREDCLAVLSEAERARAAGFALRPAADLFVAARTLARCIIARVLGCAPETLAFQAAEGGRPELVAAQALSGLRFNLAHTRGLVVCGVTLRAAIGVDVEHLERAMDLPRLAARVCSARELCELRALGEDTQRQRFAELWTLKEAYLKATGLGLAGSLRRVSFALEQTEPTPVRFEVGADDEPNQWCMQRRSVPPDHCIAVALRAGRAARVSFQEWSGQALFAAARAAHARVD